MRSIIVEIRAAEGGADSKLLVEDQYDIYQRMANKECL
ncbi:MAG: PCRF domain-containing protein [Promethearchaeota archaeon]|jgi:protein subunit release factor A